MNESNVLHIGVRLDDLRAVMDTIAFATPGWAILDLEGRTGWETWGEGREEREPVHVLIQSLNDETGDPDMLALVADLQHAHPGALQPMTFHYQQGVLAIITGYHDWSEPTYEVVDVQAKRWLRSHGETGPESEIRFDQDWWDRISWHEFLNTRTETEEVNES